MRRVFKTVTIEAYSIRTIHWPGSGRGDRTECSCRHLWRYSSIRRPNDLSNRHPAKQYLWRTSLRHTSFSRAFIRSTPNSTTTFPYLTAMMYSASQGPGQGSGACWTTFMLLPVSAMCAQRMVAHKTWPPACEPDSGSGTGGDNELDHSDLVLVSARTFRGAAAS